MDQNNDIDFEKKTIKFKRKPAKTGRNYAFYIPQAYIKNGLIDLNKEYTVYLSPVENEEEEKEPKT